ncbi:MAG: carboxymuconolactone decarboxylase family protein [Chloroflexota bacterium]|nr:carboxymuconolactone decarboxylase family protein [Chloroflexota bacterium]
MLNTNAFNRRYYHSLREIIADTKKIFSQRPQIKALMRNELISDAFRERIMLAVTEVNGCRYCQYAHAKMALDSGLSKKEIDDLSAGVFHNCPSEEVPALLYAQHWAERNGQPSPETRQEVVDIYDETMVETMELAMRMIRIGNLLGNTWDYVLFRLSFGKLGS